MHYPQPKITSASLGSEHFCVTTEIGNVLCFGNNQNYQLGIDNRTLTNNKLEIKKKKFALKTKDYFFVSVKTFALFSAAITKDGDLFVWGTFEKAELVFKSPTLLELKDRIVELSVGSQHLLALTEKEEVYSFGLGLKGACGVSSKEQQIPIFVKKLTKVEFPSNDLKNSKQETTKVKKIYCSHNTSVVIDINGSLYYWGLTQEEKPQTVYNPKLVTQFKERGIQIEELSLAKNMILALVGLKNSKDMCFSSYNPPIIKCGTLIGGINWILDKQDITLEFCLLNCYRMFTTGEQIVDVLQQKFSEDESTKSSVMKYLDKWASDKDQCWDNPKDYSALVEFLTNIQKTGFSNVADRILNNLRSGTIVSKNRYARDTSISFNNLSELFDQKPKLIAQLITCQDKIIFSHIPLHEFIGQKWSKNEGRNAPNLLAMISRFNKLSFWVSTSLVLAKTNKERNKRSSWFVELLQAFEFFQNYNGMQALIGAFNSAIIRKLKDKDMLKISKKEEEIMQGCSNWMFHKNFSNYRQKIKNFMSKSINDQKSPRMERSVSSQNVSLLVPFLGVHLSDLTFIEDGGEKVMHKEDNSGLPQHIFYSKFISIAEQLINIKGLRDCDYPWHTSILTTHQKSNIFKLSLNVFGYSNEKLTEILDDKDFGNEVPESPSEGRKTLNNELKNTLIVNTNYKFSSFLTILNDQSNSIFYQEKNEDEAKERILREWFQNIQNNDISIDDGWKMQNYKDAFTFSEAFSHLLSFVFVEDEKSNVFSIAKDIIISISYIDFFFQLVQLFKALDLSVETREKLLNLLVKNVSAHRNFLFFYKRTEKFHLKLKEIIQNLISSIQKKESDFFEFTNALDKQIIHFHSLSIQKEEIVSIHKNSLNEGSFKPILQSISDNSFFEFNLKVPNIDEKQTELYNSFLKFNQVNEDLSSNEKLEKVQETLEMFEMFSSQLQKAKTNAQEKTKKKEAVTQFIQFLENKLFPLADKKKNVITKLEIEFVENSTEHFGEIIEKILDHLSSLEDTKNYKIKSALRKLLEINNSFLVDNFLGINLEKEKRFKKYTERIDHMLNL
eukprot:TRINITY_DN8760_c0_g1_i2.p1 TRINITY_DN8760_c0_g1~~TRINITY_DN8760_c0_g1_i2.p1  ORF type:complete len:1067 (+),score=300.14 TRINITY_DN8760_c0_g1_i2:620-3820(+)